MSGGTGSPAADDVVARLREGAHAVPDVPVDPRPVLAGARRALRRRRRRQTVAGAVTAGVAALVVASPVHVAGVGTVTMPGGHQVRGVLGLDTADGPAPAPGVDLGELLARLRKGPPSSAQMAEDVANLQRYVVPLLEELRPTWYEDQACHVVEYRRGTFSDDGTCAGRPGEQRFDDAARADFDRILAAVRRSGIHSDELASAAYDREGRLVSAGFPISGGGIRWNYTYLYSPDGRPPEWESPLGPVTVTPIGASGWWFEKAPDD